MMEYIGKFLGHFKTICKHKWYVGVACAKSGIPLRGLTHDLSKFSPVEFLSSVKYYNGKRSPIELEKEAKGFSKCWQHHKGRNSHHWEYWTEFQQGILVCHKMPIKDVVELLCDWVGAGKAYGGKNWNHKNAADYYYARRDNMKFNVETRAAVEHALSVLTEFGEEGFYSHLREMENIWTE